MSDLSPAVSNTKHLSNINLFYNPKYYLLDFSPLLNSKDMSDLSPMSDLSLMYNPK